MKMATLNVRPNRRRMSLSARREALTFYLLILPWLLGFLIWTAGPMLASLALSFTNWDMLSPPRWIGLGNYAWMFTQDDNFIQSLKVTGAYAVFELPLALACALIMALFLNQSVRGVNYFRTIFYLPTLVSGVAASMIWLWVLNPDFGILNAFLRAVGVQHPPGWIADPYWALPSLILIGLWGIGGTIIIFLAGLKGIPQQLYEAAEIDGANWWRKFWSVTVPLLSPTIFFNLVIGAIGVFQTFTTAYVVTAGGPDNATLFYVLYLYRVAFNFFRMGYASAMAWVLFIIIMLFTLLIVRGMGGWVYYEGERR